MILIFTIFFNCIEAIYEALYDNGQKLLSSFFEFAVKAVTVLICLAWLCGISLPILDIPFWKIVVGFVFVRFAIFDIIWNLVREQKWNYYGTVKIYDRVMTKLASWGWFLKLLCGIVGVCFLLGLK